MPIDLLLTNATFLTMDNANASVGAVGVEGDRIIWTGDAAEARQLVGVGRSMDLGGATVLPGFNDAHNHLTLLGYWLTQVDCSYPAVTSIPDIVAALRARAGLTPEGQW